MNFDLRTVPFSRFGSFFAVSYFENKESVQDGLYIRMTRGGDEDIGLLFRIEPIMQDNAVPYRWTASPEMITLASDEGTVDICIAEPDMIRIRGIGAALRFHYKPGSYDYAVQDGVAWEVNSFKLERRFLLTPLAGRLHVETAWDGLASKHMTLDLLPDDLSSGIDLALEEFISVPAGRKTYPSFESSKKQVAEHYSLWLERSLPAAERWSEARDLASYITWSNVVEKGGWLTRPAMYMSKNWMTNIWSWDHCFNAMALTQGNPELAWDQFMIFFDRQDPSGLLPDNMNDKFALWNCCKPPIHGWTLTWMAKRLGGLRLEQAEEVYEPLARWTNWWLIHRDSDSDGVPQYNHGNDCGWDNSTVFHTAIPVESPDLCTFLILQMEALASLASQLGKLQEADAWTTKSVDLLRRMIDHFWRDGRFVALQSGSHNVSTGDSLLLFMPILLGTRLPDHIRQSLIEGLKQEDRFLTEHGLATESVASPFYEPDGYWRGPIWAPSTMLFIEGLKAAGEEAFAHELALRFCRMAARSGMAENYDALTGEGLRDRAFTWTSSVFLIYAHEISQTKDSY